MGNVEESIRVLIEGRQGPITVNGKTYDGVMPDLSLSDQDIASVLSYVRSNLGNAGSAVTPADVRRVRGMLADANQPRAKNIIRHDDEDPIDAARERHERLVALPASVPWRRGLRRARKNPRRARASRACSSYEVFVPAGRYQPFFKRAQQTPVPVAPMCLGNAPVSNAQYLDFVREHPEWRKSQVDKLFAEDRYLANWSDDLGPPADALDAPVTFVSWFAARHSASHAAAGCRKSPNGSASRARA